MRWNPDNCGACKSGAPALLAKVRLGCECLIKPNTLAYYETAQNTFLIKSKVKYIIITQKNLITITIEQQVLYTNAGKQLS